MPRVASLRLVALPLAPLLLVAAPAAAQRAVVSERHSWLSLSEEYRVAPRWTLSGEAQIRRADLEGRTPQQTELRVGLHRDLVPGARLGGGYVYFHTSSYGEAPVAAPFPEHTLWEQLQLTSRTGAVAWSNRFRVEHRWVGQTAPGSHEPGVVSWRFRNRARVMSRASVDLPSLGIPVRRAYLTTHGELFLAVGATPEGQVFDQSRLAAQAGWRFSPRLRAEAGYLQQYIQRGAARTTENNHTLLVSVWATGG